MKVFVRLWFVIIKYLLSTTFLLGNSTNPVDSNKIFLYLINDAHELIIFRNYQVLGEIGKRYCRTQPILFEHGLSVTPHPTRLETPMVRFFTNKRFPGVDILFWPNNNLRGIVFTSTKRRKKSFSDQSFADYKMFLFNEDGEPELFIKFKRGGEIKERVNFYDGQVSVNEDILNVYVYWLKENRFVSGNRGVLRDTLK